MMKINLLKPTPKRPAYDVWFKYEKPDSLIDRLKNDITLITPRNNFVACFYNENCAIPHTTGTQYVMLHGEIYQV